MFSRVAWSLGLLFALAFQLAAVWDQRVNQSTFPRYARWPLAFAEWDMFSRLTTHQSTYYFEMEESDGKWVHAPMEEWYPFVYCQGPRWNRPTLKDNAVVRRDFLAAACKKSGASHVRAVREGWRVTMWHANQPKKKDHEIKVLETYDCSRPGPKPSGKVF